MVYNIKITNVHCLLCPVSGAPGYAPIQFQQRPAQQPPTVHNGPQTHEMNIPNDLIGCIIGRGGQKINEIRYVFVFVDCLSTVRICGKVMEVINWLGVRVVRAFASLSGHHGVQVPTVPNPRR